MVQVENAASRKPAMPAPIRIIAVCSALMLGTVFAARAEEVDHSKMDHSTMDHGAKSASTMAYEKGMERMMKDMMIPYTGNADADFVRGMIPHHQGAIDMAKVVLEHGKDPEIRKLAQSIIAAQESEIAAMQEWLKKNAPQ
jgi:uncharacterized protein (DUF305 family)